MTYAGTLAKGSEISRSKKKYGKEGRTMKSAMEDIMRRVEFDTNGGCWLWTGGLVAGRYGCMIVDGKMQLVHRVAFLCSGGSLPEGVCACHKCDVPSCVNPSHIFAGTMRDNMRDASRKSRWSKISAYDVMSIRNNFVPGHGGNTAELAKKYNISVQGVRALVKRLTRADLKPHVPQNSEEALILVEYYAREIENHLPTTKDEADRLNWAVQRLDRAAVKAAGDFRGRE